MRRIGVVLLASGIVLGAGAGYGVFAAFRFTSQSWLLSVGLARIAVGIAIAILVTGALLYRFGRRAEERLQNSSGARNASLLGAINVHRDGFRRPSKDGADESR